MIWTLVGGLPCHVEELEMFDLFDGGEGRVGF